MANIVELGVVARTSDLDKANSAFNRVGQAAKNAQQRFDEATKASDRHQQSVDRMASSLKRLLAAYLGLQGIKRIIDIADTFTNIEAKIRLVTDSTEDLIDMEEKLFEMANKTKTSYEATVTLYSRVARSKDELGKTEKQLLTLTELTNKAIQVGGSTASEASAGMIQFSQSLASGVLRGDELRSVMENMPRLAEAIAKGLGVTRGELRKMGEQGELSATKVTDAIISQKEVIDREFGTLPNTVGRALVELSNKFGKFIDDLNDSSGATSTLAAGMLLLADHLDDVAKIVLILAGAAIPAAIYRLATAFAALSVAISANPIGAIAAVIGAAGAALYIYRDELGLTDTLQQENNETLNMAATAYERIISAKGRYIELSKAEDTALEHTIKSNQAKVKEQISDNIDSLKGEDDPKKRQALIQHTRMLQHELVNLNKQYELLSTNRKQQAAFDEAEEKRLQAEARAKADSLRAQQARNASEDTLRDARQELELARMTTKQREREAAVFELQNNLKKMGFELDQATADELRGIIEQRQQITMEMELAQEQAEQMLDGFTTVGQDSFRLLFSGSTRGFKDMLSDWKDSFFDFLAEMATKKLVLPMVAGFANQGGFNNLAQSAADAGGFDVSSAGSMFSTAKGLISGGNLFMNKGLGEGIVRGLGFGPQVGPLTQGAQSASNFLGKAGSLGSMAGGFAGNFLGNMAFGEDRGMGASIGGTMGALAGNFIPVPILGPMIGAFVGNAIGGLFGSKAHPETSFSSTVGASGSMGGLNIMSKHMDDTVSTSLANALAPTLQGLAAVGVDLKGMTIGGGATDKTGFLRLTGEGGRGDVIAGSQVNFDPQDEEAASQAMGEFIKKIVEFSDVANKDLLTAMEHITTEGRTADEVLSDISFASTFEKVFGKPEFINTMQLQMDELRKKFDDAADTAKRLGLSVDDVRVAQERAEAQLKSQFESGIQRSILELADPASLQIIDVLSQSADLMAQAAVLGVDTGKIALLQQLKLADITKSMDSSLDGAEDSAQNLASSISKIEGNLKAIDNALFKMRTSESSIYTPEQQLQMAKAQFQDLLTKVNSGDVEMVPDLIRAGEDLKRIALDVQGTGGDYFAVFRSIESGLEDAQRVEITEAARLRALQQSQLDAQHQTNTLLEQIFGGVTSLADVLLKSINAPGSASKLSRPGESAGALDTVNSKTLLSERLTRQFKVAAGFDFSDPNNTTFASYVSSHPQAGNVYNQLVSAAGGVTQKFAFGGVTPANQAFQWNEHGREMMMSGSPSVVYNANQSRKLLDLVDSNISQHTTNAINVMRLQMASGMRELSNLMREGNRDRKDIKQNSRKRRNVTGL